jgi:hypothetical protein
VQYFNNSAEKQNLTKMYRHQGNKWHIVDWLIDLLID